MTLSLVLGHHRSGFPYTRSWRMWLTHNTVLKGVTGVAPWISFYYWSLTWISSWETVVANVWNCYHVNCKMKMWKNLYQYQNN